MIANDAQPGSPDHPSHPHQQTLRIAERHFLSSLKVASESQLLQMRAVFVRRGVAWKRVAVARELSRRYEQWGCFGG